jgi:hypothetical protein
MCTFIKVFFVNVRCAKYDELKFLILGQNHSPDLHYMQVDVNQTSSLMFVVLPSCNECYLF